MKFAEVVVVDRFLSSVVPSQRWLNPPIPSAMARTLSLHLSRFRASSFFKPISSSSTCFFQVFFGHPPFLLPLTSRFRETLKTLSSSLLSTCPYHLTQWFLTGGPQHVTGVGHRRLCTSKIGLHANKVEKYQSL